MMDELIGRLVADSGVDRTGARSAVGIIVNFSSEEAPLEKAQMVLQWPGPGAAATFRIARSSLSMRSDRQAMAASSSMSKPLGMTARNVLTFMREPGRPQSAKSSTRSPRSVGVPVA